MDKATRIAIGALVRALQRRRVIDEDDIAEMVNELGETADRLQRANDAETAAALHALARDIGRDANIGD